MDDVNAAADADPAKADLAQEGTENSQATDRATDQPDPDPVTALIQRAETAEQEASTANSQLMLVHEKLSALNLAPDGDEPWAIGEVAADKLALLHSQNERLNVELADANADLAKAQQQLEAAAAAPKISEGKRGSKPRPIGPGAIKEKAMIVQTTNKAGDLVSVAAQLHELVQAAETVEIAFSDGENEIAGLPPKQISGNAWRITQVGLQLTAEQLHVFGPAQGAEGYHLAGYGLILDGALVHYTARSEVLELLGGQTYNLAPDICLN